MPHANHFSLNYRYDSYHDWFGSINVSYFYAVKTLYFIKCAKVPELRLLEGELARLLLVWLLYRGSVLCLVLRHRAMSPKQKLLSFNDNESFFFVESLL